MKPAIFVDRDGTLSQEIGYVNHVDRFELLPNSAAGIRKFRRMGYLIVMVTNQAGAARGYFPVEYIGTIHNRLEDLLAKAETELDGIYFCPHHPTVGQPPLQLDCDCRKPKTGMIDQAVKEMGIDLSGSYMIGDKYSDIEFAHKVGIPGIMVLTGYGRGEKLHYQPQWKRQPDAICEDLLDAADWIAERKAERA